MKKAEKQQSSKLKTTNTPAGSAEPRIYASMTYPKLVIGRLQFTDGFYISYDPEEQRRIAERASEHAIRDVTPALVREAPFTKEKRVYLSFPEPDLVVEPRRVEFRNGLFSSADADLSLLIANSPLLRTGRIRQVPEGLLQLAAEIAETRDTLKAAAGA